MTLVIEIAATEKPTVKKAQVFHPSFGAHRVANVVRDDQGVWQYQPLPPWRDQLHDYQRVAIGHVILGGWVALEAMRSGAAAATGMVVGWWLSGLLPRDALGHTRSYLIGGLIPKSLACTHGQHQVWCDQCHPPFDINDVEEEETDAWLHDDRV
ncbi:hypothetical protein SEA_TYPHA_106 [Mycobacterium phage Typha]|uniref:Uncharacterized protein n=1 Tax=Mycobacterium phage Typha TaxID=2517971 RepID=A0A482JCR0_9CAUD|nr:hypothetical protein KCH40_gp063 [Mycobacterium phage Typha]QBP29761.1 hypothetical protein SEA_TYPHA_106 [Mycobacterium phage Typha]URM86548.1 hypothetical protein PBI_HILLTOPFARM_110 [Mycobacterium phage Hilltopfarm]